jgi:tyrosyl-tRNA synthetase
MPLLEGYTDGVQKMSKSLNNYIGINEAPENIFGKIMSISDDLMWRYFELLSDKELGEIGNLRARVNSGALHPMEVKKSLGAELVARYHGAAAAESAQKYFVQGTRTKPCRARFVNSSARRSRFGSAGCSWIWNSPSPETRRAA